MKRIIILILCSFSALAQNPIQGSILGRGKPYKDKIALRWNTNNYQVFKQLTQDGVWIDRMILNANNQVEGKDWTRITAQPVKAKSLAEMERIATVKDTALAIVAEGLYGKSEYPSDLSLMDRIKYQDMERENKHLIVTLYTSINREAALYAGLGFEDAISVDPNKNYVYRITPVKPDGVPGTLITGYIYVAGRDVNVNPEYRGLDTKAGEQAIVLRWPKSESPFTGYFIERSEDKKKFSRIHQNVYLPNIEVDSSSQDTFYYYYDSVANYKPYYYRLIGINAFGEHHLYADTVRGMAEDFTPVTPPTFELEKNGEKLSFTWKKPEEKDLKGYYILTGKTPSANEALITKTMLNPEVTQYTHTIDKRISAAYYRLMLTDTVGNISYSNPVYMFEPDETPPASPTGLTGKIDTSGIVTLNWNLDHNEAALRGYKVYIANQGDHQFTPVSNIVADTTYSFPISLETLTRKVWIQVVAIDGSFNHSKPSKTLVLDRPDQIPPITPQILNYTNDKNGISLSWSNSKSSDFKENILYKRSEGETQWAEIFKSNKVYNYVDKDVKPGAQYEYTLRAIDSSGLYSDYAFPIAIRTSFQNSTETLNLTGTYVAAKKWVTLKWTASKKEVDYFILYKDEGQGLTMYKSLPASNLSFEEEGTGLPKGKYALKVKYKDLQESDLFICK